MGASRAGQIYEIYINDSLLTLVSEAHVNGIYRLDDSVMLRYRGSTKLLLNAIDNLEKSNVPRQIILNTDAVPDLFRETASLFKWIEAGGGVVENGQGHILGIFRRGYWDLPKGKLDPGETFEEAAVREVMEETGLINVARSDLISSSMHVFKNRGGVRSLKLTKWYLMFSADTNLTWQVEEDIEKAEWMDPSRFFDPDLVTYSSIRGVVKQYMISRARRKLTNSLVKR